VARYGPTCTVNPRLQVLFYAAAQLYSVFAACCRLRDAPGDQAVRDARVALCPDTLTLERPLNQRLAEPLPPTVSQRR
jgi:hypothetical protein